jgi:hypothetical protein
MKKFIGLCGCLLITVVLGSGCIPYRLKETPRVSGKVVSSANKLPVGGAALHYTRFPKKIMLTGPDGTFDFPAIYKWQLVPLGPMDRFYKLELVAEAPGYEPGAVSFQPGVSDQTNRTIFLEGK